MTERGLVSLFLFLHIGAAIIAFGATFAFPVIIGLASKEPMHRNFAIRANEAIVDRLVIPFALTMPVTGLLLIWFSHFNLLDRAFWWLDIAIVLYVILVYVAIFVQRRTVLRVIELTSRPPAAPGAPAGVGASPAASGAPAGPPPEVAAAGAKIQRNGIFLTIVIVLIVLLMVVKPQF